MRKYRLEQDFLGRMKVPSDAYYGVQTARAVQNFPISGLRLQARFVRAQAIVKLAAAKANMRVGYLDRRIGQAIVQAVEETLRGRFDDQFVVDVFQAGAGTSQNMNMNEVLANRAIEILGGHKGDYSLVHPNDHVNMAQSTNDTFHTAIHIAALESISQVLLPTLRRLQRALQAKARGFDRIVKAGRTHLQDAVPIRLGQEFGGYAAMVDQGVRRVRQAAQSLQELGIGGTAVGTGLNADPKYVDLAVAEINRLTGLRFQKAKNMFEAMQNTDACVEVSGALKMVAISLGKIAGDLRLLSSGPRTGLAEISLPAVQPGSSIMPGKVNPVMAEMLNMVVYQVIGNDATITAAAQGAQLELNVMMPIIAYALINSIEILANGVRAFADRCVAGIVADEKRCQQYAELTIALATALSPKIGYERAALVAKKAYTTGKPVRQVALEDGVLSAKELDEILNIRSMTGA